MSDERRFVSPDDVESLQFDWGVLKWMSTPAVTGASKMSCGVVRLEPGKGHERHTHPDSDEVLYVVDGNGEQEIDDETQDISAGDMLYIPKGTPHGTVNTSWETLTLLAVYAPSGPEAELRDMPDCEIIAPGELPD